MLLTLLFLCGQYYEKKEIFSILLLDLHYTIDRAQKTFVLLSLYIYSVIKMHHRRQYRDKVIKRFFLILTTIRERPLSNKIRKKKK